jgi:hypothetical protein
MNREFNGTFTLKLYKIQGDSRPLKLLVLLSEDTSGVFFGRQKDQGTGAMVDALVIDEDVVPLEVLKQCEVFDKVDEAGSLRYKVGPKTPPRGRVRRWVIQATGKFNDTTPVEP